MHGYSIGDYVVMVNNQFANYQHIPNGTVGKVVNFYSRTEPKIGVEWERRIRDSHNCHNTGIKGRCWYVHKENIEHYGDETIIEFIGRIYKSTL